MWLLIIEEHQTAAEFFLWVGGRGLQCGNCFKAVFICRFDGDSSWTMISSGEDLI